MGYAQKRERAASRVRGRPISGLVTICGWDGGAGNTVAAPPRFSSRPNMPKSSRAGTRAKRWCFTINNFSEDEKQACIRNLNENNCEYAICAVEVGENKTPHIQGFVHFKSRQSLKSTKKTVGDRAHVEVARGTDADNEQYCSKDGNIIHTVGTPHPGGNEAGGGDNLAKRVRECAEFLSEHGEIKDLPEHLQSTYILRQRAIKELAACLRTAKFKTLQSAEMEEVPLRSWQQKLISGLLFSKPDPRKIIWYNDADGNSGKSWITKLLVCKYGAVMFENGRSSDIKHAYDGQRIVIFDLSRSQQDHFNYEVLESIKNGLFFSSKYDSGMRCYPVPHVIVFANWPPEMSKLSADRWEIIDEMDKSVVPVNACVLSEVLVVKTEKDKDIMEIDDSDDDMIMTHDDFIEACSSNFY